MLLLTAACSGGVSTPEASPTSSPLAPGLATVADAEVYAQLAEVAVATAAYRDRAVAAADGYRQGDQCTPSIGSHWIHDPRVEDPQIDLLEPEIVIYDGSGDLVAVEYLVLVGDLAPGERPRLFGTPMSGPLAAAGLPDFYWRHVWLWRANPSGIFNSTNASVAC